MSHLRTLAGLSLVALAGCGDGYENYYPDRSDPSVSAVEPAFEFGNVGGQQITITGSGFGEDAGEVVVLIDNHNAEVLSVTDSEIVAVTPPGPITGGAVDLLVATETGYTLREASEGLYRYGTADFTDSGEDNAAGDFYEGQRHYVQVLNLYGSCYGGIGAGLGGCEQSAFFGRTGIAGEAEFLRFSYPRLHTIHNGWLTGFDAPTEGWHVGPPEAVSPSGIDDLRRRLQTEEGSNVAFRLRNPLWDSDVCVDPGGPVSQSPGPTPCDDGSVEYNIGEMTWCETRAPGEGGLFEYRPDYPVNYDFFQGNSPDEPVQIELDLPGLGLVDVPVLLPPEVDLQAEEGFADSDTLPWDLAGTTDCFDSDGNGQTFLNEDGIVLTWTPIEDERIGSTRDIVDVNSYLHISFTSVDIAWYGLEVVGVRASRVVPDIHDTFVDEEGNTLSRVVVPNDVLFQLPTPNTQWSDSDDVSQRGTLGRYVDNPRYLFMEVYRVTDYRVRTDDGPMVFSYSTGAFTFMDWDNPATRTRTCRSCLDDDGDGWVDERDPDCNRDFGGDGRDEVNATSEFTCNDGIDNNRDGRIDANDPLCENGWDGETTCGDRLDNDGDGWIDALDPDCIGGDAFSQEDGTVQGGSCNDGIDNDGDGWIDSGDPACVDGLADEDDGFSGTACNDGVDNDQHGDPDHLDLICAVYGASYERETPPSFGGCVNGRDDDGDGYTDGFDPECEVRPHSREREGVALPEDPIINECYDGIDNDGNGLTDAQDASCWNPLLGFAADGFLQEGVDRGTGCTDGTDEDGDGWIDGLDPDCAPGSPDTQDEVGLGDTQCNDGIDNDGDGLIDDEDADYCRRGSDNFEGPS